MKMNILRHELRVRRRAVAVWLGGMLGLHLLYLPFYGILAQEAALVREMMAGFPPAFLAAFGLNGMDMTQVLGFYSLVFSQVQLALAVQAANYGFGLLSQEEAERTADFLLTKPVSRSQIWCSKTAAALLSLLLTQAGVWAMVLTLVPAFRAGHPLDFGRLVLLLASLLPFQLVFFSLGLALSMLAPRIRAVAPWGLGLSFGLYVLNAFSGTLGETHLEWLTPFHHFDAPGIIQRGGYDPLAWISLAAAAAGLLLAWRRYLRRDIPSVS